MIQVLLHLKIFHLVAVQNAKPEGELGRQWSTELREPSEWEKEEKPEEQKKKGFLSGLKSKLSEQHKENQLNLDYSQHEKNKKQDESEYETDSDTSSVISQDDPELHLNHLKKKNLKMKVKLTTFAQPYGLTAPKNPTDIPSFEPSGTSTQKNFVSSACLENLYQHFKKLKSVFSSPDYEQLLKTNFEELKEYIYHI